ncbi:ATP-binding protein [Candidatus Margulisiibacteriota bacterium]
MTRHEELKEILEKKQYFKLVCGAGNEDPEEVYKLVLVYALAGGNGMDMSANVDVVKAAVKAIDKAYELAPTLGVEIKNRPFLMVSIGLKGDPHVQKARILRENCTDCGACMAVCNQQAIEANADGETTIIPSRCIGCNDCYDACNFEAIEFYHKKVDPESVLPQCLEAGAENIELHAVTLDDESVLAQWELVNKLVPDNFISMCLDRKLLSNDHLIQRISKAYELAGERTVIQADGVPMSGGKDDFNTTLQTIAIADIVQKSGIPVKILASGGTNNLTGKLAKQCRVTIHGSAIGTFARNKIKEYITQDNFENEPELIKAAVKAARELINNNLEYMHD